MVADVVVGVAQAVARGGLPAGVGEQVVQGQCLAIAEGLGVVAQVGLVPADSIAGTGLTRPVIRRLEKIESVLGVVERQNVLILVFPQSGEGKVSAALSDGVAKLTVQINSVL